MPKKANTHAALNKLRLGELHTLAQSHRALSSLSLTHKKDYVTALDNYYQSITMQSISSTTASSGDTNPSNKNKNANNTSLIDIGRAILRQINTDAAFEGITHVIIENQISTIATRMKTIQGMLVQSFLCQETMHRNIHVEFVSSHNKLKGYQCTTNPVSANANANVSTNANKPGLKKRKINAMEPNDPVLEPVLDPNLTASPKKKGKYQENKKNGIDICRRFLLNNSILQQRWMALFEQSKKKDDLADCFLQGIWYLKHSLKLIQHDEQTLQIHAPNT